MSIISFIEDHKVFDKIIAHLKLTFMADRPPPPQIIRGEDISLPFIITVS
ncbi:MAG: acid--CoA ligase [Candidatus Aminicenantaceae bacterium]